MIDKILKKYGADKISEATLDKIVILEKWLILLAFISILTWIYVFTI